MRRKWVLAGAGAALLTGTALLLLSRRETPEDYLARIKPGMTVAEVEAVFGRAPDEDGPLGEESWRRAQEWKVRGTTVIVIFDEQDRVWDTTTWKPHPGPPWFDKLQRWLGL